MKRFLLAVAFLGIGSFAAQAEHINNTVAVSATRVGGPVTEVEEGWAFITCDAPMTTISLSDVKGNLLLKVHPESTKYELYIGKTGDFLLTISTEKDTYVIPVKIF